MHFGANAIRVYYDENGSLYECFPDKRRNRIEGNKEQILNRSKLIHESYVVFSDSQINALNNTVSKSSSAYSRLIVPENVEFLYNYGLIGDSLYNKIKGTFK